MSFSTLNTLYCVAVTPLEVIVSIILDINYGAICGYGFVPFWTTSGQSVVVVYFNSEPLTCTVWNAI